jgi:hypothetical protein
MAVSVRRLIHSFSRPDSRHDEQAPQAHVIGRRECTIDRSLQWALLAPISSAILSMSKMIA